MLILCLSRRFSNLSYGALLRAFGVITLGLGVADLISSSLKEFWGRPKPFVVHVGNGDFPLSFPSNHATNISFFCVLMAGAWVAKWPRTYRYVGWLVLGTLAIAVSVSRVTFGQHYPLDVVAGCGLGAALAGLSLVGLRWSGWLQPNRR